MAEERRPSETRRAIRNIIIGQGLGGIMPNVLLGSGVMALLVLHLGGSNLAVGAIAAANLLAATVRIWAGPRVAVVRCGRVTLHWMIISSLIFCLVFALGPIRAWCGDHVALAFLLLMFLAYRAAIHYAAAFWEPYLSEIIPDSLRGRFFGRMRQAFGISSLIAMLLAGRYLGSDPDLRRFMWLFAALLTTSLLRPILIARLPNLPPDREGPAEPLLQGLFLPLRDEQFRRFLGFYLLFVAIHSMGAPFAIPFVKQFLQFPSSFAVYAATGLALGGAVSLTIWGKLTDRWGNRFVFLIAICIVATAFVLLAAAPSYTGHRYLALACVFGSFVLRGVGIAGVGIAETVRLLHAAPSDQRGRYLGLFMTAVGLTGGVLGIAAGAVLDLLPKTIAFGAHEVPTARVHFPLVAIALIAIIWRLQRLHPLSEPRLRRAIYGFSETLPYPLGRPFALPLWLMTKVKDSPPLDEELAKHDTHQPPPDGA